MPFINIDSNSGVNHALYVLEYGNLLNTALKKYINDNETGFSCISNFDIDSRSISKLSQGGQGSINEYLPQYLIESYTHVKDAILIFDDVMASASDDIVLSQQIHNLKINNEFYRSIFISDLNIELLQKLIWCVSVSWHFVCIVVAPKTHASRAPSIENFIKNCDLTDIDVLEIIIGAFDEEGYVHLIPSAHRLGRVYETQQI